MIKLTAGVGSGVGFEVGGVDPIVGMGDGGGVGVGAAAGPHPTLPPFH